MQTTHLNTTYLMKLPRCEKVFNIFYFIAWVVLFFVTLVMQNYLSHIDINPEIRFGKPCIKNTRIAVLDILQWLASGMNIQEILADYPILKEEDIFAALHFAAHRESISKIIAA